MCLNSRRGEALSLFVDEEPTFAYLPAAYYYRGLVREAIETVAYRESFERYLEIRGDSIEDPLLDEIRERMKGGG